MVEPVRAAARAAFGQVGDDRALGALGEAVVERVDQEQADDLPALRGEAEANVGERIRHPAERHDDAARVPVGQRASWNGRQRLHQVVERPQQRQRGVAPADLVCAQQQERIRRVAEREQHADAQVGLEPGTQRAALRPGVDRAAAIGGLRVIAQPGEQHDRRQHADPRRDQEHGAHLDAERQQARRDQRSQRGAEVIQRSVEAERPPALRRRNRIGDQRVARPGANPLAGAVDQPRRQHVPGHQRHRDAGTRDRGERVATGDQQPAWPLVGQPARGDLEDAGQRVGAAFDDADVKDGRAQRHQEHRQQREDRLARQVVEQAGEPEQPDDPRQAAHRTQAVAEAPGRPPVATGNIVAPIDRSRIGRWVHGSILTGIA